MKEFYEFGLWLVTVAGILVIAYELFVVRPEDEAMRKRKKDLKKNDPIRDLKEWETF